MSNTNNGEDLKLLFGAKIILFPILLALQLSLWIEKIALFVAAIVVGVLQGLINAIDLKSDQAFFEHILFGKGQDLQPPERLIPLPLVDVNPDTAVPAKNNNPSAVFSFLAALSPPTPRVFSNRRAVISTGPPSSVSAASSQDSKGYRQKIQQIKLDLISGRRNGSISSFPLSSDALED